ncbi:agmatinase [Candidatus Undinarchaeota archaeon]
MGYLPANNFGMLPEGYSSYKEAKVAVLPVPYGATSSYISGTQNGPDAIIKASHNMELFDKDLGYIAECGIHTMNHLAPAGDPKKMVSDVEDAYLHLRKGNKFVAMFGGEHSISTGAVSALKREYPKMSVLQLDAHTDLRDEWEGSKHSHACVMKRISEICPFVGVGIRSMGEDEFELIKENKFREYYAEDILKRNAILDNAISDLSNDVYLTIDLDFFDPSVVPAVGTPEPGGLDWYTTLNFLRKVFEKKNIIGLDIVELCPIAGNHISDFTAAKLAYTLIGLKSRKGFE